MKSYVEEIWKPINPKLNIEDCYEVSNLGRIRNTRYNKIQDDIHHSTNGFDYIFIATKDHKPSYQHIDIIVCMTFCPDNVNNVENGKPIIPYHKDGNTRNNQASNLEFVEDVEIWKPIVYKDIVSGVYSVSNHGRLFDHGSNTLKSISFNGKYYPAAKFMCTCGYRKKFDIHPIVATMFISGYDNEHRVVNHINNSYDNHWRNLEWCTFGWNNAHARHISNYNKYNITIDQVDIIRDMLIEYRTSSEVYKLINHEIFPNVTYDIIEDIKRDKNAYNKSWKYTKKELKEFRNNTRVNQYYTTDDITYFCKVIKECNLDINKAYHVLTNAGYSILRYTLYSLARCKTHRAITEKYFGNLNMGD